MKYEIRITGLKFLGNDSSENIGFLSRLFSLLYAITKKKKETEELLRQKKKKISSLLILWETDNSFND